jgi:hypothetical protein
VGPRKRTSIPIFEAWDPAANQPGVDDAIYWIILIVVFTELRDTIPRHMISTQINVSIIRRCAADLHVMKLAALAKDSAIFGHGLAQTQPPSFSILSNVRKSNPVRTGTQNPTITTSKLGGSLNTSAESAKNLKPSAEANNFSKTGTGTSSG